MGESEQSPAASLRGQAGLITGLVVALAVILFCDLEPGRPEVTYTLAVALLMAVWWITEALPLAVTALLPVALFPILGIMNGQKVSATYFNHVIFLFIGGFLLALAMQKWNLHRRIALRVLTLTGASPARILLGFMAATAFLSMWISNTATAMLMIPIVLSIILELEKANGEEAVARYAVGLLLGVAYSASVGGIATLVGTPPNLSFIRIFQIYFPEAPEISFARWLLFAFPITVTFLGIIWGYLYLIYKPAKNNWQTVGADLFQRQYQQLGPMRREEKTVLAAFVLMAVLWICRADIDLGIVRLPGYAGLFPCPDYINDGTVAIFVAVVLFALPAGENRRGRIMDWQTAKELPWNIVLLFGGGFALASGFKDSGLSLWFGRQLAWVSQTPPVVIILVICLMLTFLTEMTSNTATTEMILPILAGLAISININPLYLMLPATLSASMAFMLPVATPPNAIIFGTNRLQVMDMAKTGLALNLIGTGLSTLFVYFLGSVIFGMTPDCFPLWAAAGARP